MGATKEWVKASSKLAGSVTTGAAKVSVKHKWLPLGVVAYGAGMNKGRSLNKHPSGGYYGQ